MTASFSYVSADQYHALQSPLVLPTQRELFDYQVGILQEKGLDLPDEDVDRLYSLIPSDSQLFLVVPRRSDTLDLKGLMRLIIVNREPGENYLDPQHLTDVNPVPTGAHLLIDIEDGRKRLNTKHDLISENIQLEGRIAYSAWYGLIHGILFPYVLESPKGHNLDLFGSRYESMSVPCLSMGDKFPMLKPSLWRGFSFRNWGAPSAGSAVGA